MINDLNLHENAKLVEISICTKQVSKTRDTKNIELDLLPEIFTMMMPLKLFLLLMLIISTVIASTRNSIK